MRNGRRVNPRLRSFRREARLRGLTSGPGVAPSGGADGVAWPYASSCAEPQPAQAGFAARRPFRRGFNRQPSDDTLFR